MNRKTICKKFIHGYCSFNYFPFIVYMLWVEHFANQIFLVFNDSGRNPRRGAFRLVKVHAWGLQRLVSL